MRAEGFELLELVRRVGSDPLACRRTDVYTLSDSRLGDGRSADRRKRARSFDPYLRQEVEGEQDSEVHNDENPRETAEDADSSDEKDVHPVHPMVAFATFLKNIPDAILFMCLGQLLYTTTLWQDNWFGYRLIYLAPDLSIYSSVEPEIELKAGGDIYNDQIAVYPVHYPADAAMYRHKGTFSCDECHLRSEPYEDEHSRRVRFAGEVDTRYPAANCYASAATTVCGLRDALLSAFYYLNGGGVQGDCSSSR